MTSQVSATEALERLREGNERFVAGKAFAAVSINEIRRRELVGGQSPIAVVIGCSDSRVPVEVVFDQAPGELFVIRAAGNVSAETQIGSVDFAVGQLGTPLVIVLGHTRCGAVSATLEVARGGSAPTPALGSIVDRILPAVRKSIEQVGDDSDDLMKVAIRSNVQTSIEALLSGSDLVAQAERSGELQVVGAEYDLASGTVVFL